MKKVRNNLFYVAPKEIVERDYAVFRGIGQVSSEFKNPICSKRSQSLGFASKPPQKLVRNVDPSKCVAITNCYENEQEIQDQVGVFCEPEKIKVHDEMFKPRLYPSMSIDLKNGELKTLDKKVNTAKNGMRIRSVTSRLYSTRTGIGCRPSLRTSNIAESIPQKEEDQFMEAIVKGI